LKKVCSTFKCRITIAGSGSTRKPKEEERRMLESGDPKFSHLVYPLHAEITTSGLPHEAHERLSQLLDLMHQLITDEETFERNGIVFEANMSARENNDGEANAGESNVEQFSKPASGVPQSNQITDEVEDQQQENTDGKKEDYPED